MSRFIPFPAYTQFAPLDISFLFEDEKPAGKHGFLQVQGDHFVFADGTKARFWGTNLNSGACFPTKEQAKQLAKRLAAYGCNMVRFHQIDAEWATPNIFQMTKGRRLANTGSFDPEAMDRLDYLMACLKEEGIYTYLDMMTYRKFKNEDGVRKAENLIDRAAPYCLFDPALIEKQKEYMKALWEHKNPYTGLCYKDDPAIALTDVVNEVCLFGSFGHRIYQEPYATEFREMFRTWCAENGKTVDVDSVDLNSRLVPELVDFKIKVVQDYYDSMIAYMRSLGVKVPATGQNFSWKYVQCKSAQHSGDFMDSHLNVRFMDWQPPRKITRDISLHEQPEWGAMRNVRMRRFGKPFFTSEWDVTFPNRYRAESSVLLAAMGMLQDWSGYTIHTYAYTSLLEHMDILGKEVSSRTIGDVGYREGIFSTWNDPAKFGMFYHAAIITRREDVSPSKTRKVIRVEECEADNDQAPGGLTEPSKKAFIASAELCQLGVDYYGEFPDAVPDSEPLVDLNSGEVRSDTGQMYRSWEKRYGTIDTPMTKAVYGRLGENGKICLNDMWVDCKNDYAVAVLSSLNNDLPIHESDSMLLTVMGRVENTDMKMSVAPDDIQPKDGKPPYLHMDDYGKPPIICEVIEGELAIRTDRRDLRCWSVNAEGLYAGTAPIRYEDGYAIISLGKGAPSVYYLIQAQ